MDFQENSKSQPNESCSPTTNQRLSSSDETNEEVTRLMEGDTYSVSDNESESNGNELLSNQGEQFNKNISQDSLNNDDEQKTRATSKMSSQMSTLKSSNHGFRSLALDEQIRLVKQKKEEAEILRLQRFQDLLKIKEQKWQQQQTERMKKWLQLKNRDNEHRVQVEERRKKCQEQARAKIDELIRREKERQQRIQNQTKTEKTIKADGVMTMSTDVISSGRRAISASRFRPNQLGIDIRRTVNQSPISTALISCSPLNPIDENSLNFTVQSNIVSDGTSMNGAHFMRSTYSANCRTQLSQSGHRCPKAREENCRVHLQKARPNTAMAQSIHVSAPTARNKGLPISRSSHQLRVPTPPVIAVPNQQRRNLTTRPPAAVSVPPNPENGLIKRPKLHSKPPTARSLMTTSFSSGNVRRLTSTPPVSTKPKSSTSTVTISSEPTEKAAVVQQREASSPSPSPREQEEIIIETKPKTPPPPMVEEEKPSSSPQPTEEAEEQKQDESTTTIEIPVNVEPIPVETMISIINLSNVNKRESTQIDEQEYQEKLNRKIREARQREEERQRQLQQEEFEREQEQIRLVEEQRRAEEERLKRAIEERERENELKRQEEIRLQQQREELERRQAEEAERLQRERQERAKKEEEERIERKRRLDLIMRRTRQVSPTTKETTKPTTDEQTTNGHDQNVINSPMTHSMSENLFIRQNETIPSPNLMTPTDTPKFKSPLIQSLLNKARNTRSIDSLMQTSINSSKIVVVESNLSTETVSSTSIQSNTPVQLSDDDEDEQNTNLSLTASTPISSYHDRPMETATAFH